VVADDCVVHLNLTPVTPGLDQPQCFSVIPQVIINKTGDEIIAVVIALLHTHLQRMVSADTGLLQGSRFQFFSKKLIIGALVNQDG